MTITSRDRRALLVLGLCGIALLGWRMWSEQSAAVPASAAVTLPVPALEKRLTALRARAALNPAKQEVREVLAKAVEEREKSLLRADTPQQAQAALLAKVRAVLDSQEPPLQAGQVDLAPTGSAGEDYGEVAVTVAFPCAIEQLVNVLADIRAMEDAVATRSITVSAQNRQKKILNVRLTVSALTPREPAPEPNGGLAR